MTDEDRLTPEQQGEPQNIIERKLPSEVLKSMKQLKKEQRARANMLDLNGVESDHQQYRKELAILLVILLGGLALFSWLTGF
jgi:hypothetical protein